MAMKIARNPPPLLAAATASGGCFRYVEHRMEHLDPLFLLFGLVSSEGHRKYPNRGWATVSLNDRSAAVHRRIVPISRYVDAPNIVVHLTIGIRREVLRSPAIIWPKRVFG